MTGDSEQMASFNAKWKLDPETGCHVWTVAKDRQGYGRFRYKPQRNRLAHRWLYQQVHGLTDEQMPVAVCHVCDNPGCVREEHLWPGTIADNNADRAAKGRTARQWTLTESERAEIRTEYACGVLTQQMLGEVYGVSDRTICQIVRDRPWRDPVPSPLRIGSHS